MATVSMAITQTPTNAVTAVPLDPGANYSIHNPGGRPFFFAELTAAPATSSPARNLVRSGERVTWATHDSDGLWFWTDGSNDSVVVFDDIA